ncbi:MAG: FG-GAP-like repeat-containing protein [Thermoguttaceae bacterium]
MSRIGRSSLAAAMAPIVLACLATAASAIPPETARELDTRRLLATAHYENGDFKAAAAEYRRCIVLDEASAVDRFNLALVLTRATQYEEAMRLLDEAQQLDPNLQAVHYIRGIIHKRRSKYDRAIESLQKVISDDLQCWGTHYNLGTCYKYLRQYDKARAQFEAAARIDPNHPSAHYQLIILARRAGDIERTARHMEIFERVKKTIDESEKTPEALERSKFSDLIQSPKLTEELVPETAVRVSFTDVTAAAGLPSAEPSPLPPALPRRLDKVGYNVKLVARRYVPATGGAVALGDYDGDGDLDIYVVHCAADPEASANRLYRNEGNGRFSDVTATAAVGDARMGTDAVFGDYDNDGHNDLYVVNYGPNVLYHNRGDGTFEDLSAQARVDEPQFGREALFVDYDHDSDLDILVVNDVDLADPPPAEQFSLPEDFFGQVNTLLRNNGDGTFTDQTDEAGLLVDFSQSRAVVFADFDADHDADLFVCNADAPSLLFANARLGKFTTLSGRFTPAIHKGTVAVAESDFNRDGDADLLVAGGRGLYLYDNDGEARFTATTVPLPAGLAVSGVGRIDVFDYNDDGWLDLLLAGADGRSVALLAGSPSGRFRDVSASAGLDRHWGRIADLAAGDLDGDGDADIVLLTRDRGLRLLRGEGNGRRQAISVRLVGKKVNRSAYGATVEIAASGHYQKQTVRDGWLHFGLGALQSIDVVRVTWPNGVAQNVIDPPINCNLDIVERIRISASCGFLWADGGDGFELINEILGVGPLGVPMAPGVYHPPDCTELTKIESHQLVPKDGIYELRLTEELREIMFADKITLRVVDHPAGLQIVPNEMFTAPPFPEDKFFAVKEPRRPRRAVDDRGTDVLPLVLKRDGRFPTFPTTPYEGLARPHAITLDLGDLSGAERITLFLDGWIYWPESSTVTAIAQDARFDIVPLSLEVRDARGRWQTVIESVGLPTSKGLVVPVDLSGRFPGDDYHVRLSTNLCVYFDRIFVSTGDEARACRVSELPVAEADLHYRGFCRMERDRFGFERFDYADFKRTGPWSPPQGMMTRYGTVTPLLAEADDRYVIFGPGDELTMRFDGRRLPDLPTGWVRDFIFYANGWVKDGDLNTALSDSVGPLPFHGMSGYPYAADEHYPRTPKFERYLRQYNTRSSTATVGRLRQRSPGSGTTDEHR